MPDFFYGGADNENEVLLDYRGNPADKSKTGGWFGAGLILGTELSQRIILIGITMNLVTYLCGVMNLSPSKSASIVSNFMGSVNLLALFGGFLADAKFGRFRAIVVFSSICALGVALLGLITRIPHTIPPRCDDTTGQNCIAANSYQLAMLYIVLFTVALGAGGIKSNVSVFGFEQFDKSNRIEEKATVHFFSWFYFYVTMGSVFAAVMVYIQDTLGRVWGYAISAVTMIIALFLLLCGRKVYRYNRPQGSPLTVIARVLILAWKKRNLYYPDHPIYLNGYTSSKVGHTQKFRCLDKAAIVDDWDATDEELNNPRIISSVNDIEDVKIDIKLIPIWSACSLFWTVYSQIPTFTIQQATIMNRNLPGNNIIVPAGSFSIFLYIPVLLFTYLNVRVIFHLARKLTRNPKGLTSLQSIGIGLIFSVAGMVVAAIFEMRRREMHDIHGIKISAFWLVPQFFLVGVGDTFAYVGQLEFFVTEAPERMKSMSTGLFFTTTAMGCFMSSALVAITNRVTRGSWLNNLDEGKLNNFYWVLAILGALNLLAFLILASRHQYKAQN